MFFDLPLLSFIIFFPLLGAFLILLTCGDNEQGATNSKFVALWISIVTFIVSLLVLIGFNNDLTEYQYVEKVEWVPIANFSYHLGIDGISLPFVILSSFLIPICILASWRNISKQVSSYMSLFLILETF